MKLERINIGARPNDGAGDPTRTAYERLNRNADTIEAAYGAIPDLAAVTAHLSDTDNPHGVTKAQVGLTHAADLAPEDYPVSTAQAAAIQAAIAALSIGNRPTLAQLDAMLLVLADAMLDGLSGKAEKGPNADIGRLSGSDPAKGVDLRFGSTTIASGATVDIGAADTVKVTITATAGAATIASLGTVPHGWRRVRASGGAVTFTHNANIVIPGAVPLVLNPGDFAWFMSDALGVWSCVDLLFGDGGGLTTPLPPGRGGTGATTLLAALNTVAAALPTTMPAQPGQLWNNDHFLAIS